MENKNYPFKTEDVGGVVITPDFWDCNCDVNYIHPRAETYCKICGAKANSPDQPDAHADEVMRDIYHK